MEEYKKRLRFNSIVISVLTNKVEEVKVYPSIYRMTIKRMVTRLLDYLDERLKVLFDPLKGEELEEANKLSEALEDAIESVYRGYSADFDKKEVVCKVCSSNNITREAKVRLDTGEVIEKDNCTCGNCGVQFINKLEK